MLRRQKEKRVEHKKKISYFTSHTKKTQRENLSIYLYKLSTFCQSPKQSEFLRKENILSLRERVRSNEKLVSWRTALKFQLSRIFEERKDLSSSSIMLWSPSVLWQPAVSALPGSSSLQWQWPTTSAPASPTTQLAAEDPAAQKKVLWSIPNWISHRIFPTCTHKGYWGFKETAS